MAALAKLKMHCLNFFYVCLNLMPVIMPAGGYAFWRMGSPRLAWSLFGLVLADLAVPLRKEGPWQSWCRWSLATKGKVSYHKAEVVIEAKLEKAKNYIIVYHPHSLWGYGFDFVFEALYRDFGTTVVSAGADAVFMVPLLRRVMAWWGLTSVSRSGLLKSANRPFPRNAVALSPGGIAEMFYGLREEQLVLAKRKGFCRIALETGAHLVPFYLFGANELFTRYWGPGSTAARISKRISASIVIWTGRFGLPFGFIPHPVRLVAVVGAPIEVEKVAAPTPEQVDALHARYVEALRALFDKHKSRMGPDWKRQRLYLEDEQPPVHGGFARHYARPA